MKLDQIILIFLINHSKLIELRIILSFELYVFVLQNHLKLHRKHP